MDFFETLKSVAIPNRDNGECFVADGRLEKIGQLLWNSRYRRVDSDGLYVLYAAKPLHEIGMPIVISSHVDCVPEIKNCYVEECDNNMIRGTFDNFITNAAILNLMVNNRLPDNVLVAFTGDEEDDSVGAMQLSKFLLRKRLKASIIVLDVTNMGWSENADFTIENNFWKNTLGRKIIEAAAAQDCHWMFVPSDPDNIPKYIDSKFVCRIEAEADESWEYDEYGFECFSLCLPVYGEMHSNDGVLARKKSCMRYVEVLNHIVQMISVREP